MKYLTILFLITTSFMNSFAQCNIEKHQGEDIFMVTHGKEAIFEKVDDTGGMTIFIQISAGRSNKTQNLFLTMIPEVLVVGGYNLIVPRQIEIGFVDGPSIRTMANSLNSAEYNNGRYSQSAFYVIDNSLSTALKTKSISYIQITDNRQAKTIKCQPYKDLVMEQINCVLKEF